MKQEIDILSGAFSSQRLEKYVNQLRHKDAKSYETGLGVICKVDGEAPIYNELNTNPPFPAWKDGLGDLWN